MEEKAKNRSLSDLKGRLMENYLWHQAGDVLLNSLEVGVALLEMKSDGVNIIYHNNALCKVMGYDENKVINDIVDMLCPRDRMALVVVSEQTLMKGKPMTIEVLGVDKAGKENWIHVSAKPVDFIKADGIVALAVITNITHDKEKNLESTINYERCMMLQEAMEKSVYFEYDNISDSMTLNYRTADGGIDPVTIHNYSTYAKKMHLVHPEDRELFFSTLARACSKVMKKDFRYRTTIIDQQSYKWAKNTFQSIADSNGRIVRIVGRIDDIDDAEKEKVRTTKLIEYDSTTGVYNKLTAATKIQSAIEENKDVREFFAIVDLDDFKEYNDTYGHSFGDEVLKSAASDLVASFPDGIVGRFGGDEFILYVTGYDVKTVSDKFASYLKKLEHTLIRGENFEIRCSVGVVWSENEGNYAEYFDEADALLYKVKNSGKNDVLCEKL